MLQGVHTTLVLALPQIGFALAPHIQLEKVFLFLGSLARGLGPVQLFPARYLYPDAHLGGLANMPAPIFADLLPTTGGFAYPCVDCEPDPWRVLARFGNGDRYYGYPFRAAGDSMQDFTLHDHEDRAMLLPSGQRVVARRSETCAYATLDPALQQELGLDREGFEDATCLLRGAVTHDGLPFSLPAPLQPLVFALVLTHWRMELDRAQAPGQRTEEQKHFLKLDVGREGEPNLRQGEDEGRMDALQHLGLQFLPEAVVITHMAGVDAESGGLRG